MKPSSKANEAELTVLRLLWTRCQARRRWIGYLFLTTASRVNYGYVTDLHVDWYLTQPPEPAQVTSHEHAQQQEYESGWAIPANLSPTSQYAPNGMLRSPLVFQPAKYWRHNSNIAIMAIKMQDGNIWISLSLPSIQPLSHPTIKPKALRS